MEITFDPWKSERNLRERNLSFEQAAEFDFASASYFDEVRNGEHRLVAVGYLKRRLHILCFLPTAGGVRVISFRKANDRMRANMANRKPLTDDDGEVRELTEEDVAQFVPFSALPVELQALLSEEKHIKPDAKTPSKRQSAA